jgi:hypothetical protein
MKTNELTGICVSGTENSPFTLNLTFKEQKIMILAGKDNEQLTEISFNPTSQEVSIKFHQTVTTTERIAYQTLEPVNHQIDFWDYYDQYLKLKKSEYSPGFIKQINSTRNVFQRFYGEDNFDFETIDISLLEKFRAYYLEELGYTKNSFAGHIKRLKFFLNYALKNDWTQNEKFKEFNAQERYGKPVFLTWEELMKIYGSDYGSLKLNQVRDAFVFQSTVGCRYQDLRMFKINKIFFQVIE